jgi:hypothetical protein
VNSPKTAAQHDSSKDGRTLGMLAIAASPGAILFSPIIFSMTGFFLSLVGLTIASPKQKMFSIIGLVLALSAGAVGHYFNTAII